MKALLWWSSAATSVYDVAAGAQYGLEAAGVELAHYHTDRRIVASHRYLHSTWRRQNVLRKQQGVALLPKPNVQDDVRHASEGCVLRAERLGVDWVICVSGLWLDPWVFPVLRKLGKRLALICTESPYEMRWETELAGLMDHVWTMDRSCLPQFQQACPSASYLQHAWHPETHTTEADLPDVASHDVVFVGTGFPERLNLIKAMDWTGIDLGLYGHWAGLRGSLRSFVKGPTVPNTTTAALYRKAKIGLNLHRTAPTAESMNPRCYELARCGRFFISDRRPEVSDVFGATLPTFETPTEATALLRHWLDDDAGREARAAALQAAVAGHSWRERGQQMVSDLLTAQARREAA